MLITDSQFKGSDGDCMERKVSLMDKLLKLLSFSQDMVKSVKIKSRMVVMAGTGITLTIGVFYAWSIFKEAIKNSIMAGGPNAFQWKLEALNDPFAVCVLVSTFATAFAGRVQDKLGPRITGLIGGILVGGSFVFISQTTSYVGWIFGFGILLGMGVAFGHSAALPPGLKWYPPNKTGTISGIIAAGLGLAPIYIAPLAKYMLGERGLLESIFIFGIAFFVVICCLSLLLANPPEGYKPEGFVERRARTPENVEARAKFIEINVPPSELIRTGNFWIAWLMFAISSGAGLMVIGNITGLAQAGLGEHAFMAIVILSVGSASGRLGTGIISDKIGRRLTLRLVLIFQSLLMCAAIPIIGMETLNSVFLILLTIVIGFNFGSNLTLFPALSKDLWGYKNFGTNFGILFTAMGVGGFVFSRISQTLTISTGSFNASFIGAGILLVIGTVLSFFLKNRVNDHT